MRKIPSLLLHLLLSFNSQLLQQVKTFLCTEIHFFQVSKEEKKEVQLFRGLVATLCASPGVTQACRGSVGAEFDLVGKGFVRYLS